MPQPISLSQLTTQLTQNAVAPLYVLVGEEDLLRDAALAQLKRSILGAEGDDFNCDLFYGDEAEGSQITACASEVAVFAARRLVIVKTADKLPARQCEVLLPYIKDPNESTTVVFAAAKLDGRLKFTQALMQASVVVDCGPLKEIQLVPWLKQEADRLGIRLEEEALHMLKEACGGSLYSVRREIEKLASYVPPDRAVKIDDVATLRGTEPGASVFDLAAAIGAKNQGKALAIVARNLEAGEAPLRILGSLAWQYRRLWKVKELIRQGAREGEAARTLRMDPYKVRAFLGQFPEAHLQDALRAFLEADAKLKGGSGGRPAMLLDRLILQLCDRSREDARKPATASPAPGAAPRARTLSNVRTISATRSRS
ncbi:MAG TPA: DNA polymerase III subunit delta [Nitrospira sp.]|nr:DNA polymerase III subunit delta [Nitrospira sp.]